MFYKIANAPENERIVSNPIYESEVNPKQINQNYKELLKKISNEYKESKDLINFERKS